MCHSEQDPQEHLCNRPLCVHSRQMGLSECQSLLVTEGPVILETEEREFLWKLCGPAAVLCSFSLHRTLTVSMFTDKET